MLSPLFKFAVLAFVSHCAVANPAAIPAPFAAAAATCPCYTYTATIALPCVPPRRRDGGPCPSSINCPSYPTSTTYIPPTTTTCSPYSTTTTYGTCAQYCKDVCGPVTVTKTGCYAATVTSYSPVPGHNCPLTCVGKAPNAKCTDYTTVTQPPVDCHCRQTSTKTKYTACPECGCTTSTVFVKPTAA